MVLRRAVNARVAWRPVPGRRTDSGTNPDDNGDKVQLWTCNDGSQQQWWINQLPDGTYEIVNEYGNLVLAAQSDSGGSPTACGDNVQLQDSSFDSGPGWTAGGTYAQCG